MKLKQEFFTMLGGRVKFRRGEYNPSCDAVWLAAFIKGRGHNLSVLDIGIGTGAVSLCFMHHCPDAKITGLDISQNMLDECRDNAQLNERDLELVCADILNWKTERTFDIVMTNPPYFNGTDTRHGAHHNADLYKWTRAGLRRVTPRGYFYTIIDAAASAKVITALYDGKAGDIEILPLFSGKSVAERVLISARLGTRGGTTLHAGLPLDFEPVLRQGLTNIQKLIKLGQI